MLFNELPLYEAVHKVRQKLIQQGEKPGAEEWYSNEDKRKQLCQMVLVELFGEVDQKLVDAAMVFRKGTTVEDGKKKIELIVEVGQLRGFHCFYADRGLGPCSDDVHLERLIPETRGGRYTIANCVLSCGRHNISRGDTPLEEFLLKGQQ